MGAASRSISSAPISNLNIAASNANLDLDVGLLMILLGFLLPLFAPWIPGINRIPRWIPLYKIIYHRYYASSVRTRPARGGHRAD